ncbi:MULTISPECIES: hypothetical protein [Caballeronia]|nr:MULTISPECIES: hypothetical protein [Caballeronia]
MSDALAHIPDGERHAAVVGYGFTGDKDLEAALMAKRRELETSQNARAEELATNDKRLAVLLAACGLRLAASTRSSRS